MKGRNNLRLAIEQDGQWIVTPFSMKEFENKKGWVMIHCSVIFSLTKIREKLTERFGEEIEIIITDSTRTEEELEALAKKLGWTDEGGTVSRNSKHLEKYGGLAVDFYARYKRNKEPILQSIVGEISRKYFDFVKANYKDGHIHGDNRKQLELEKDL